MPSLGAVSIGCHSIISAPEHAGGDKYQRHAGGEDGTLGKEFKGGHSHTTFPVSAKFSRVSAAMAGVML